MADNKSVTTMAARTRASVVKTAKKEGIKNIGHKSRIRLAREVDRSRKDKRNQKARDVTEGRKFAKRTEKKRRGIYRPKSRSKAFWDAYKEGLLI
jgi:hypothetical protein